MRTHPALLVLLPAMALAACGGPGGDATGTFGPNITLRAPAKAKPVPTINVPKAVGWAKDEGPKPADGFVVNRFAEGLDHPRWLYQLPNGDVLVAESSSQSAPIKGVESFISNAMQKRAGALGPSANRIILLRDADQDGTAEVRQTLLEGLNQPIGMALIGQHLYVANTDAIMRYDYVAGSAAKPSNPVKLVDLPHSVSGHWTRNLLPTPDGKGLYVAIGSASNIADGGLDQEQGRAMIRRLDLQTNTLETVASGLRNPVGLAIEPQTGALWTAVNERDMLGDDLVPDYLTSVTPGAFYGWPWSYYGQNVDGRVQPTDADKVSRAIKPDYALGAHTASLGLGFYTGTLFPQTYQGGAFVGQHGSWNRKPVSGYKVIFVPFQAGKPAGLPRDFLTGFLNDKGEVRGRPVGVLMDQRGALLVADDNGNIVWRVVPSAPAKPE
jgi:glucose/arabinose dehydrogenase